MKSFARGFHNYFVGLGFWMKNSSLLRLSIIPLILNFIFLIWGLVFAISHVSEVVSRIVSAPQVWYQYFLYYLLVLLTALGLFLVVVFLTLTVANLIAFPFNSILAERALKLHDHEPGLQTHWFIKVKTNLGAMVRRTIIFLIIGGALLIAGLIPGLGILGGVVGVFLMAYDRMDYGFDHFTWTFSQRKQFVKTHFWEIAGFAAGLGLTSGLPVINILAQPGSVVSGALLVADISGRNTPLEGHHSQASGRPPEKS